MPFTSEVFEDPRLPKPLPVVDIFEHWRWLSLTRLSFALNVQANPSFRLSVTLFNAVRDLLAKASPALATEMPYIHQIILKLSIRRFLIPGYPSLHFFWWSSYFMFSDIHDFEQNYLTAWSQRATTSTHLFVDDAYLRIPLPDGADDAETLKHLRMYYGLVRTKRSLREIVLPKELERIDRVLVNTPIALGGKIETIDLGRCGRRLVSFFDAPDKLKGQYKLTEELRDAPATEGVEFVRLWDRVATSVIVLTPLLMSLVFAAIWVGLFVARGHDLQATMQTAFTVASFMVTAGALIIALVAFLEQTGRQ